MFSLVVVWFALILSAASFVSGAEAQAEENAAPRKVVTRITPAYPQMARNINLSGGVRIEALVSADGSVKSIKVRGGNPLFAQSAEGAVREWKWEKSEHETTELVEVRFNP